VPFFENLPAEQRTAQAGMLSTKALGDILAVESGCEKGLQVGSQKKIALSVLKIGGAISYFVEAI